MATSLYSTWFISITISDNPGKRNIGCVRWWTACTHPVRTVIAGWRQWADFGMVCILRIGFLSGLSGYGRICIGRSLVQESVLHFENGNSLTIDAGNNSAQNVYIQSLQVDGNEYTKNYLRHGDLLKGGTLKFEMGDKPTCSEVSVRKIIRIRFLRKSVGSCMFFVPLHSKKLPEKHENNNYGLSVCCL